MPFTTPTMPPALHFHETNPFPIPWASTSWPRSLLTPCCDHAWLLTAASVPCRLFPHAVCHYFLEGRFLTLRLDQVSLKHSRCTARNPLHEALAFFIFLYTQPVKGHSWHSWTLSSASHTLLHLLHLAGSGRRLSRQLPDPLPQSGLPHGLSSPWAPLQELRTVLSHFCPLLQAASASRAETPPHSLELRLLFSHSLLPLLRGAPTSLPGASKCGLYFKPGASKYGLYLNLDSKASHEQATEGGHQALFWPYRGPAMGSEPLGTRGLLSTQPSWFKPSWFKEGPLAFPETVQCSSHGGNREFKGFSLPKNVYVFPPTAAYYRVVDQKWYFIKVKKKRIVRRLSIFHSLSLGKMVHGINSWYLYLKLRLVT